MHVRVCVCVRVCVRGRGGQGGYTKGEVCMSVLGEAPQSGPPPHPHPPLIAS